MNAINKSIIGVPKQIANRRHLHRYNYKIDRHPFINWKRPSWVVVLLDILLWFGTLKVTGTELYNTHQNRVHIKVF